ncbi:MAG: ABC transporter ATP-binding protein [Candidatus Brocadiae bacterium]|nr:ABC transporter ATP-binding protein [Candidatus Brocadiia bacterium]
MVRLDSVSKVHRAPQGEVRALDGVSLHVAAGEFVAIKGPSGSGKSTFLLAVGGMVRPTSGTVAVDGTDIYALSSSERARFRAEKLGFVFQMFHLVPYLSVLDNVLLPTMARERDDARQAAGDLIERFGLAERAAHKPAELSTGERQRVAMARALLNRPRLILADEPTGNLDPDSAADVMGYLADFHREGGTIIFVTHEDLAERYAQRTIKIREGKLDPGSPEQGEAM